MQLALLLCIAAHKWNIVRRSTALTVFIYACWNRWYTGKTVYGYTGQFSENSVENYFFFSLKTNSRHVTWDFLCGLGKGERCPLGNGDD